MKLDFFTHWMITLSVAGFLGLCGITIDVVRSIQRARHRDESQPAPRA